MLLTSRPRASTSPFEHPPLPTSLDEELPLPKWPIVPIPRKSSSKHSPLLPGWEPSHIREEEYRKLPPSVQKKYFSDLERLHYAYAAAQSQATSNTPHTNNLSTSSNFSSPCALSAHNSPIASKNSHTEDSRLEAFRSTTFSSIAQSNAEQLAIGGLANVKRRPSVGVKRPRTANPLGSESPEHYRIEASSSWYGSLPEKVRRQHLSSEEREAFGAGLDHFANNLSRTNSKRNSRSGTYRLSQSLTGKAVPFDPMDITSNPILMESQSPKGPNIRDNVKRAFTFSKPFHTAKSSVCSNAPMPPQFPIGHNRDRSRAGTIMGLSRPSVDTTSTVIDPDAMYYQSPEARSKLRQYLVSPQKFDEALAYGFPSTPTTISTPGLEEDKDQRKFSSSSSSNDAKAFLKDDAVSFLDRPEDSMDALSNGTAVSDGDTDAPATPADPDWSWKTSRCHQQNRFSIFDAFDTDNLPSLDLKFQPETFGLPLRTSESTPRQQQPQQQPMGRASPIYHSSANSVSTTALQHSPRIASPLASPILNREMTLRMTLTRPDLRASEDELYGWQQSNGQPKRRNLESRAGGYAPSMLSVSVDPLSLANLPEDAEDPMQSIFAKDPPNKSLGGSKVLFKRMMKRMRKT